MTSTIYQPDFLHDGVIKVKVHIVKRHYTTDLPTRFDPESEIIPLKHHRREKRTVEPRDLLVHLRCTEKNWFRVLSVS